MSETKSLSNPDTSGHVGFANPPNQVHRKSVKKGSEFTLMAAGESGLGKSTLINSLLLTDPHPDRAIPTAAQKANKTVRPDASTAETEERGVKPRPTVADTPGPGDAIDNTDSLQQTIRYTDDQFERYLKDESGLNRKNITDNRVHCRFHPIPPHGHGPKPPDTDLMKELSNKVSTAPATAKSDRLTMKETAQLKQRTLDETRASGIKIHAMPDRDSDEDEDYKQQVAQLRDSTPPAVRGATTMVEVKGKKVRGRQHPWGVVEAENPEHRDFTKPRPMPTTQMQDLQEVTHDVHYENLRPQRLAKGDTRDGGSSSAAAPPRHDKDRQLQEKDDELRRMQDMLAKMQEQTKQQSQTNLAGPGKQHGKQTFWTREPIHASRNHESHSHKMQITKLCVGSSKKSPIVHSMYEIPNIIRIKSPTIWVHSTTV